MSFTAGAGTRFIVTANSVGPILNGPVTATAGTATTNTPAFDITQTWNNAAVTFTGLRFNITDNGSNGSSLLVDLQLGGSSLFSVRKDGYVAAARYLDLTRNYGLLPNVGGLTYLDVNGALIVRNAAGSFAELARLNASGLSIGTSQDVILTRDAANTLAQRNGVNAQTFNLYGTYTDGSNYRRVAIAMTAAGVASIAPAGLGTGASGNVLHISGLPTANPGPGILWNDAGTVKVGT